MKRARTNVPWSWATALWRATPNGVRASLAVVLYLLAYLLLDTVSEAFDVGAGVSVWYLPSALSLVLLLVLGLRFLPALFAAVLLAQLVNNASLPLLSSLVHALTYTFAYGGATLFLRRLRVDPRLYGLRDVVWFMLVGAFLAPLIASFFSVTNFTLSGSFTWSQWLTLLFQFAAGDATGIGALAPFLLVMLRHTPWLKTKGLGTNESTLPEADASSDSPEPQPATSKPSRSNIPEPNVSASHLPRRDVLKPDVSKPDVPGSRSPDSSDPQEAVRDSSGRWPTTQEVFRVLLFAGVFALAAFIAYAVPQSLTLNHSYVTFIPVLLVAGWYGFGWGTAATLCTNVCVALFTFSKMGSVDGFALQFGLVTLTYLGILLGAFVSERKSLTARLHYTAFHDALTGLPNRALFLERLARAVREAKGEGETAVLFIDLDRFKGVNDGLGHAAGDAVLVEAARRLRRLLRPGDTVARLGGDEFTVLLEGTTRQDAVGVAERIQDAFASPFLLSAHLPTQSQQAVQLGASVGIALNPSPGTTPYGRPGDLLRNADTALSRAKSQGRASYAVFDPAMYEGQRERLRLESELERALKRQELSLHYQPIVLLGTGKIVGVEALLRWRHPERGLVAPDVFIPVAEQTGLIIPLGVWMMERALGQLKAWHDAGHAHMFVSVNVSARQAGQPQLVGVVRDTLEQLRLDPECVALELTESVFMESTGENVTRFVALHDLGVRLSIDDFGTGYSSLSRLKSLPVHTLKIDRSFLTGVPGSGSDAAIVRTILAMAHNLNLNVVAEGVERNAQAEFLRAHGCDQAQGYLFSRPLPADALTRLLGG